MLIEEANQEQEDTTFGEDFDWDDEPDEDENDELDEDETDTEGEENDHTEEQEDDGLIVKYNGQDKHVAKDEIPELVQKGLNYDHIHSELESMRSGNMYRYIKKAADKAGMSPEQFAKAMQDKEDADILSAEEAAIRKDHPNMDNAIIRELAEARAAKKLNNAKAQETSEQEKAWAEALKEYPNLTRDTIPNEVLEAVAGGKSPLLALKDNEIAQLKAAQEKAAIEKRNQKNKEKSTGSMTGYGSDGDEMDDFLKGFTTGQR